MGVKRLDHVKAEASQGDIKWSPTGRWLATARDKGQVVIQDAQNEFMLHQVITTSADQMINLDWNSREELAFINLNGTLGVWSNGEVITTTAHSDFDQVRSNDRYTVSWSPQGEGLISAGQDGMIKVWRWHQKELTEVISTEVEAKLSALDWSPDGRRVAVGDSEGNTYIWKVTSGPQLELLATFTDHHNIVWSVSWHPDSNRLASASQDKNACVRDINASLDKQNNDQATNLTCKKHQLSVNGISWSPDGSKMVTASDNRSLTLWQSDPLTELSVLYGPSKAAFWNSSWSPDGKELAAIAVNGRIWIYPAEIEDVRQLAEAFANQQGIELLKEDEHFPLPNLTELQ